MERGRGKYARDYLVLSLCLYALILPIWHKQITLLSRTLEISFYAQVLNLATVVFILSRISVKKNAVLSIGTLGLSFALCVIGVVRLLDLNAIFSVTTIGSLSLALLWMLAFGITEHTISDLDKLIFKKFYAHYLGGVAVTYLLSWYLWKHFISLSSIDGSVSGIRNLFLQLAIAQGGLLMVNALVLFLVYRRALSASRLISAGRANQTHAQA